MHTRKAYATREAPRQDGRSVLSVIENDDRLKQIPVVILTTSKAEEDVLRSYWLHARCYITKPVDLEKFISVVKSIDHFLAEAGLL